MRLVCYLGTRGCRPTLADALRSYHDRLALLVPADPALLGPHLQQAGLERSLLDVAGIVETRALEHASRIATAETRELTEVFEKEPPDPDERIASAVLEGALVDALDAFVDELDASPEDAYISRDALDVLDEVGSRPDPVLERYGIELVAR